MTISVTIEIVREPMRMAALRELAAAQFGDFVKAVVDVRQGLMAIGGELHADEEALLLAHGSRQEDLWGVNLYPDRAPTDLVEFDSMINVRPLQHNRSRGVDDPSTRERIEAIVGRLVLR